ncbi:hypothetical protein Salat_2956700 [Sesamum alatum]|uniref:Uncharacterized protein n=1 Tax=Sesamum alatum TaxID=300844 RepID=A0AAE1XJH2_9LAMI|nr:hypothetical protein Salat_2956700 [Sesamum alatum]
MDKENFDKTNAAQSDADFCFPSSSLSILKLIAAKFLRYTLFHFTFAFFWLIFPTIPNNSFLGFLVEAPGDVETFTHVLGQVDSGDSKIFDVLSDGKVYTLDLAAAHAMM